MKKIFSIAVVIVLLLSVLHLTVGVHYCCGSVYSVKVSQTGAIDDCGMQHSATGKSAITSHCCDNEVIGVSTDTDYAPSFTFFKASTFALIAIVESVVDNSASPIVSSKTYENTGSPGFVVSSVKLADICVYRI